MASVDDTTLVAYVDGELDAQTAREIEDLLEADPSLAARVRDLRETTALIAAAFNHVVNEREPSDVSGLHPPATPRRFLAAGPVLALAASLAALAVGVALGLGIATTTGSDVGSADAARVSAAFQRVLESEVSGVTVAWRNETTGNAGEITPVATYRNAEGRFCREFEESRIVAGVEQREAGVACRQPDGRWRVRIRYYP